MPLVDATCPNCGGTLEVNNSSDAAICKYCGTPFIVEKAIEIFNTNNHFNVNASVVNYYSSSLSDNNAEFHFEKAKKFFFVEAFEQSYKEYMDARACAPEDGEIIFWGMIFSRINTKSTEYSKDFWGITPKEYVSKFPQIQQYEIDLLQINNSSGNINLDDVWRVYYRLFFGLSNTMLTNIGGSKYGFKKREYQNVNNDKAFDMNRCLYLYRLGFSLDTKAIEGYITDAYESKEYEKIKMIFENDTNKAFDPYSPEQLYGNKKESFYNIVKKGLSYTYTYTKYGGGGDWEETEKICYPKSPEIAGMIEQYYPRDSVKNYIIHKKNEKQGFINRLFKGKN